MPLPICISSRCKLCSRFLVGSDARAAASRRSSSSCIKGRVFQQADHLGPDNLVEQVLSNEATVVANRTAQFSPAIGPNALVIVVLARARVRRGTREGAATLLTADQSLHHTGFCAILSDTVGPPNFLVPPFALRNFYLPHRWREIRPR
jgi:hypothetical protein